MKNYFNSKIGRLRLLALLEGSSLLILFCIAVPLKYIYGIVTVSEIVGPIHGMLFILFVFNTLSVGVERNWKFLKTTWKVLLACIVPFGTFYIDYKILRKIHHEESEHLHI